jgi:hypothetical protein
VSSWPYDTAECSKLATPPSNAIDPTTGLASGNHPSIMRPYAGSNMGLATVTPASSSPSIRPPVATDEYAGTDASWVLPHAIDRPGALFYDCVDRSLAPFHVMPTQTASRSKVILREGRRPVLQFGSFLDESVTSIFLVNHCSKKECKYGKG